VCGIEGGVFSFLKRDWMRVIGWEKRGVERVKKAEGFRIGWKGPEEG
jgi:hypothetical protein